MVRYRSAKGLLNFSKFLECRPNVFNSLTHHWQGACFFNGPPKYLGWLLCFGVGLSLLAPIPARAGHIENALEKWRILRPNLDGRGITLDTTNTTDIGSDVNRKGGAKALVIGDQCLPG